MTHRHVALGFVATLCALLGLMLLGSTAGAQGVDTTLVAVEDQNQQQTPSIIPTPNSGDGEIEDGDPGSAAQYTALGLTVAGLAVIVLMIARESRRKRDRRTPTPT